MPFPVQLGGGILKPSLFAALTGLIALLAAVPAGAQTPPAEPPLANSSNVHLLGHIPGSAAGMNFKGNYAFVSGWGGITVLDISTADQPRPAGALPLPHFENEDVDLCGNTLIVVNDRVTSDIGSVLYVVNIANPTSPTVSAVLPLGLTGSGRGSIHPLALNSSSPAGSAAAPVWTRTGTTRTAKGGAIRS